MMNSIETITMILIIILTVMITLTIVLGYIYWKSKRKKQQEEIRMKNPENTAVPKAGMKTFKVESVMDFMEFDKVEDNMIVEKNGEKYVMVIECQGVNYDLMSANEKIAVEEGFVQFLNSLRHPIQIYTQTRTIDLNGSIHGYQEKLKEIEQQLQKVRARYESMKRSGNYSQEQLDKAYYEVTKQTNLYEYGKDIIKNTEKMSLNKNVLSKRYYIIISFFTAELGANNFDKEEQKNMAFSELYTRAQAIVRTISSCGINSKVLSSNELAELLYVAYNRDESEIYSIEKALQAGYDEVYSTAPDILDKKMRELDKEIEKQALDKAIQATNEVKTEKEKMIREKEVNMDELIDQMAAEILRQNADYIGEEVAQEATEKIKKTTRKKKEGGEEDGTQKPKRKRRTTKSA